MERLLISRKEASVMLSISQRLLWSLTASGVIPCVRLGRAVRYSVDDLRQFISENRGK
ncbi:helix-turn-helix domain-containing protein [Anatilimnocola floriformis]|uniref:helix-turn-helix domain-containing protein n=1 Tax=Anatilimnocola floriformis TaxID=2948575 RepID=UPI0036F2BB45